MKNNHLVNFINSYEFKNSHNRCKDLEFFLKNITLDEKIFCYLIEILNGMNNNNRYVFIKHILNKIEPIKPTKYLTIEIICGIIELFPYYKTDVLLILEPFICNIESENLVTIFKIINPSCLTITNIIKTYFHKIPEIKGNDFIMILNNMNNRENTEYINEMAKLEFIAQCACKLKNCIDFLPEILNCFNNKKNVITTTYYLIYGGPKLKISYSELVNICALLSNKNKPHIISGFVMALVVAQYYYKWDFSTKNLTIDELCFRLSRILDTDSYQLFVKVFINGSFIF
uniref:Uncharacterized protein n=1 Tax=Borely moumouvirus TaxID=2712067 RepID=A0A6G6ACV0_9VIRU